MGLKPAIAGKNTSEQPRPSMSSLTHLVWHRRLSITTICPGFSFGHRML